MKLHRFFVSKQDANANRLTIDDPALVSQWTRVLRFAPGHQLALFDAAGAESLFEIAEMTKRTVELARVAPRTPRRSARAVTLLFSLLKKDKVEWVIQKGTELGATRFAPIISARTEKTGFNRTRAEAIAIEAAEQCGRADIPEILDPTPLDAGIVAHRPMMEIVVADEGAERTLAPGKREIGILIGPEGGWSEEEKALFRDAEIEVVALAPFTLRAETACIAACLRASA
ncbi:MAG TPA: RsmE family RNA methyltransferase [Candidatus Paceibacterota bacterium]|nr:RsmE family RNA methyltransferase [Candidatus Paceibacterota bacterium]